MKKSALLVICVPLLGVAACKPSSEPAADVQATASAVPSSYGPDAKPGIVASDGLLKLPAVQGNPGVAYFTVKNATTAATTIVSVNVDVAAKAEMHETKGSSMAPLKTVPLAAGATLSFAPGSKHVMVFNLDPNLTPGKPAELTLGFAGGDKISIPLKVEATGDGGSMGQMPGMAAMPGMDHH